MNIKIGTMVQRKPCGRKCEIDEVDFEGERAKVRDYGHGCFWVSFVWVICFCLMSGDSIAKSSPMFSFIGKWELGYSIQGRGRKIDHSLSFIIAFHRSGKYRGNIGTGPVKKGKWVRYYQERSKTAFLIVHPPRGTSPSGGGPLYFTYVMKNGGLLLRSAMDQRRMTLFYWPVKRKVNK